MNKEVWKDVPDWEDHYKVSNYGRCYSKKQNKIKALDYNNYGYARLQCYDSKTNRKTKLFVHRLVATLFCDGFQEGFVVNHKDGNKQNNYYENLEWVSNSQNQKYSYKIGTSIGKRVLIPCTITIDGKTEKFESIAEAGRKYNINGKRLNHCIRVLNGRIPEINGIIRKCVSND